jgi:phospholipase C
LLPFHFDTSRTNSACTHDVAHDWVTMHQSWNNGAMDGFVTSRLPINGTDAVLSMGFTLARTFPFTTPWRMLSPCATTTSAR